jgi:UDP-glucose 4-epimerase
MAFLITGGMGALGSSVARNLVNRGEIPIIFDFKEDYTLVSDIRDRIIFYHGDVTSLDSLKDAIKKYRVHCVIHTVALLSVIDPKVMLPFNNRAVETVLWAALDCKVNRVINISSKGVYNIATGEFSHPTYKPVNEDYPKDCPMGFYGVSKCYGELLGNAFQDRYGIEVVSLRFSTMYGPGRLLKNANSLMVLPCRIIESAMLQRSFKWDFGGDQVDDYIGYEDSSEGVVLAAIAPSSNLKRRAYNIGSGCGYTLRDFASAAKSLFPEFDYSIGAGLNHTGSKTPSYCIYDISSAKKDLGYVPQVDLCQGVRSYVNTMNRLGISATYVE